MTVLKTLVLFNNKGGVGKTTLTCNLVSYLNTKKGMRALLIDADPQCNASQAVLADDILEDLYLTGTSEYDTLFTYLKPLERGDADIVSNIKPIPAFENEFGCDIIPSHPNMSMVEDRLSAAWSDLRGGDQIRGYRISNWMAQLLAPLEDKYDIVVFDVGPSLGALNRTILLASDYVVTPFGSDIFSLLGIKNIASWIASWSKDYDRALSLIAEDTPETFEEYPGVTSIDEKFRFAGYSVQQYVTRTFKTGRRPVKAYDEIMSMIPATVEESLKGLYSSGATIQDMELGHVPFLYSLVPLAQAHRVPIHALATTKNVAGAQVKQVDAYAKLMDELCDRLLRNMGLAV